MSPISVKFFQLLGNVGQGVAQGIAAAQSGGHVKMTPARRGGKKGCTPCAAMARVEATRKRIKSGRL